MDKKLKFSSGDRVRLIVRGLGIVRGYDYETLNYVVQFDGISDFGNYEHVKECLSKDYWLDEFEGGVATFHPEDELKIAQVRNTKIARKMHPEYKVIDEKWLEVR